MTTLPCPRCHVANDAASRFCMGCGQSLDPQVYCPSCNAVQPMANRFCVTCGAETGSAGWQPGESASGSVIEGVWERDPQEFVRRVDPEEMRRFLGNRSLRVPPGSIGVVLVDGVVHEVLPPGLRTTLNLFERVADFFTGRDRRTAFFLIDLRPIPVPFTVQTATSSDGQASRTQVVVSFAVQRGDRDRLATFLGTVVGDRANYSANDLYNLLRPEVTRLAQRVIERATERPIDYAAAEATIRRELLGTLGVRFGVDVSVAVGPLMTTATLDFHLGTGAAPQVRPCTKCAHELPAAMRFCDACGEKQPTVLMPARTCDACGTAVTHADEFCNHCGATYTTPPATAFPLLTQDGQQLELDVVVRVQGQADDFSAERLAPAIVGSAAAFVRSRDFAALTDPETFTELEATLLESVGKPLESYGMRLVSLNVVDLRSKNTQWMLGARSDLTRARQDLVLGRDWLNVRGEEYDLEELTLDLTLRQQRIARDQSLEERALALETQRREASMEANEALSRDQIALQDRQRRQAMADATATLDVADAQRTSRTVVGLEEAERDQARFSEGQDHIDTLTRQNRTQEVDRGNREYRQEAEVDEGEHRREQQTAQASHAAELARQALELDAERGRSTADTAAYSEHKRRDVVYTDDERRAQLDQQLKDREEQRQIEKLRAMTELEKDIAAQEHAHAKQMRESLKGLSEREMIAAQATELAATEGGGAAWASALAAHASHDAQQQRLADKEAHVQQVLHLVEKQQDAVQGMMGRELDRNQELTKVALSAAEQRAQDAAAAHAQASAQAAAMATKSMEGMASVSAASSGSSGQVYGESMDAMSRVAASRAQPEQAPAIQVGVDATTPCVNSQCSAQLRVGSKFCGTCGGGQSEA